MSILKRVGLFPICGKLLRASITTLNWKQIRGTRLIADPNSKKIEDWTIRRLILKPLCKAMYYVSTTTRKVDDRISNPK